MQLPLENWVRIGILLVLGFVGGTAAFFAGLPMPYLLGSLFATSAYTIVVTNRTGRTDKFPPILRRGFVATIGVMIGASFSPELFAAVPSLWMSLAALFAFVLVNHAIGYAIFRRIGKYDRTTAIFTAMPGGLIEAITLGEQAGGDVRAITVQHFARIILVVVSVPALFFLWSGEVVGSAAGQTFSQTAYGPIDLITIAVLAAAGIVFGKTLRIPAAHLMGPLILSAACHAFGVVDLTSPAWLLNLAQLVIGSGLGAQFSGVSGRMLSRAFGLGILSVAIMLAIGGLFAFTLSQVQPIAFDALFISFAPGGVTEMGLIALSLNISPVIVATHHLFRIGLTVLVVGWLARSGKFAPEDQDVDP